MSPPLCFTLLNASVQIPKEILHDDEVVAQAPVRRTSKAMKLMMGLNEESQKKVLTP